MSLINSNAVGMVGGSIGLMWNGPIGGHQDLLYRPSWTGDSIDIDPNGNTFIGSPPHQNPWIQPHHPNTYGPIERHDPLGPLQVDPAAIEELRRFFEQQRQAQPVVPQAVEFAPPAEPEGVDTTDSFKPKRKLDMD